jgi:large subunit ribosomal protein L10
MKSEKQVIIDAIVARINESPFMLIADYGGMKVDDFAELRNRLRESGSEMHVEKNSFVRRAANDAELPEEVLESLGGQIAVVTGESDVCAAAKALKEYGKKAGKPEIRGGVLDGEALDAAQVEALASLPSKEVLLGQLLGVFLSPAQKLVTALNEPGASLARVLQAKHDQG